MKAVLSEIQPTQEQVEEKELREMAPEKFEPHPLLKPQVPKGQVRYRTLTREETQKLIEQSNKPIQSEPKPAPKHYDTYLPEEVQALIEGTYHPNKFKHLRKKKSK